MMMVDIKKKLFDKTISRKYLDDVKVVWRLPDYCVKRTDFSIRLLKKYENGSSFKDDPLNERTAQG